MTTERRLPTRGEREKIACRPSEVKVIDYESQPYRFVRITIEERDALLFAAEECERLSLALATSERFRAEDAASANADNDALRARLASLESITRQTPTLAMMDENATLKARLAKIEELARVAANLPFGQTHEDATDKLIDAILRPEGSDAE